jgi:hypothetical protein
MSIVWCLLIAIGIVIGVVVVCKWKRISIIPKGLRLPPPQKFRMPRLKRLEGGEMLVEQDSESDEESDSNDSGSSEEETDEDGSLEESGESSSDSD